MPDLVEPESLAAAARTQLFSPYATLQEHASRQPDAPASIIDARTITFGDFLERVTALAGWLVHNGFVPGEATGLSIRDEVAHIDAAMAVLCLGTAQVGLGSHESGATKRALARKIGVTQLIVETQEDWMEGFRTIVVPNVDAASVHAAPRLAPSAFQARPLDRIGVFQNTSGSTNLPKTFGLTLERLLMLATRYSKDPKERRSMRTGSIEFDAHRLHRVSSLMAGQCSVFLRHVSLRNVVDQCERAEVSGLHIGVYKLTSLLRAETQNYRRLPSFTTVHTGGSRVPGRLREDVKRVLSDNLFVLYATSEVGMISRATPDQHESFPEGVGFPAASVTLEIIGPDGEQVAPGEIGQIRVRKGGVPKDYIAEPGTTSNFQEGWFYPRDLVSLKPGEPLIFYGRADDVMILNGINIFPSAIEDTLESHPDVKEAVAYAIKSRVHGEIPVAAVILKDTAEKRDATHLLSHCRQALGIRAPRQIVVVDRIPRNSAGKPLRRELSAFFSGGGGEGSP